MFRSTGTLGGNGGASNGAGATAGKGESAAGDGEPSGGESSGPPDGGSTSGGGSGAAGANGGSGATASAGGGSPLSDCTQFGADASYFADTQHCYLVVGEPAPFAAAQAHCKSLGAHLVTLANEAEDRFAWRLNSEAHWIGANDGNGPNDPEQGTFSWVTGEPFSYSNWSVNQPNTSDTDCGDSGFTGHCYEHCAYQWSSGEQGGQWNDRFCLYAIAAICEWDSGR